jgi:hypothetical protein
MHLRWIYVKDHAPLFAALTVVFVAALVIAAILTTDPTRGLLLGILPTLFALVVWALTNRAGYPDRFPQTMAHHRAPFDANASTELNAGDPFEPAPTVREANPEPASHPRAPTPKSKGVRAGSTPTIASSSASDSEPGRPQRKAGKPPSTSNPAPTRQPAGRTGGEAAGTPQSQAGSSQRDPEAEAHGAKRKPGGDPEKAPAPAASDSDTEHLSPAEAAKRDAAARKRSKEQKDSPDTAA